MPAKELRFDEEAHAALKRGVDAVAGAVSVTLGPRGRAVVLDKKFGPPVVTNDGVTIARELDFKDHFENMGAAAQGSGDQDQRHRRRRHHHGNGAGSGDDR